jgi:predicted ester cyclase
MKREAIDTLIRRWTEAIATGDIFDELLAEDVCDRSSEPPTRGRATFKARAAAIRAALADITMTIDDRVIDAPEETPRIAWRWTLTGTHVGPLFGLAPTQARIHLRGVNFQKLRDGVVVEHWTMIDAFGAREQIVTASDLGSRASSPPKRD